MSERKNVQADGQSARIEGPKSWLARTLIAGALAMPLAGCSGEPGIVPNSPIAPLDTPHCSELSPDTPAKAEKKSRIKEKINTFVEHSMEYNPDYIGFWLDNANMSSSHAELLGVIKNDLEEFARREAIDLCAFKPVEERIAGFQFFTPRGVAKRVNIYVSNSGFRAAIDQ